MFRTTFFKFGNALKALQTNSIPLSSILSHLDNYFYVTVLFYAEKYVTKLRKQCNRIPKF